MLWIKAFHIIAVVAWFSGLLYLPRLFVYHAEAEDDLSKKRFEIMEKRLYKVIMTPALLVTFALGAMLIGYNMHYYLDSVWFYVKFALAIVLLVYHLRCGRYMRDLAAGRPVPSSRFFRWFNEAPAVILIIIVLLVELQPKL